MRTKGVHAKQANRGRCFGVDVDNNVKRCLGTAKFYSRGLNEVSGSRMERL